MKKQTENKKTKIRVAILGAGGAGRNIMGKDIAEHAHLYELAGFHDPSADAARKAQEQFPGTTLYPSYEALLEDASVDLVLIATIPHAAHPAQAIQAAGAGKHCVVIKPFCFTVAEADAMIAAAKAADRVVTSFQNVRWSLDFLQAMETLQKRDFGQLLHVASNPGGHHGPSMVFYDFGSHYLDQLFLLAGSYPVEVSATFWAPDEPALEGRGSFLVQMRMANGVLATLDCLPPVLNASSRRDLGVRFKIVGTKEHYVGWRVDQLVDLTRENGYVAGSKGQVPYYSFERSGFLEYRWNIPTYWESLFESIRSGAPLMVPPEHTRQVAKVFEAAGESSRAGRTVLLEDDGPKPFPLFSVAGGRVHKPWVNKFPF